MGLSLFYLGLKSDFLHPVIGSCYVVPTLAAKLRMSSHCSRSAIHNLMSADKRPSGFRQSFRSPESAPPIGLDSINWSTVKRRFWLN